MRRKAIDYDAMFKDFLGDFFPDFVAFVNPELYAAIDWAQGYVFLEQELINALRGKFKLRGKRKHTDKLVKVQLLNGDQHFIFVHIEFQHQAEKGFALRMFLYRALIQLRYGLEDISAYAVFTGAPPPEEETLYLKPSFGTELAYRFQSIIAVTLPEEQLLNSIDNAFALAMLAAQYVYRSRNDPHLRFALKVKLFNLLRNHSNIHFERTVKLFIFVRDLIHLPKKLENEFEVNQFSLVFPNEPTMIISQGTKNFTEKLYEHVFGYSPAKILAEQKQKAEAVLAKERQKAEIEFQKKAELEHLERQLLLTQTIHNLHQLAQMDVPQIALMMGISEAGGAGDFKHSNAPHRG
ncbi:MAG: hypothetical protein IPO07_21860 [Haliscomenobacter sp.]|nr:hypothetical protein [Haliscomenobacter sp.]MBK9491135.1 hypothetical protein [Haliscomenobacter sp.]